MFWFLISCTKSPTTNCCPEVIAKTEDSSSAFSNISTEKETSVQAQSFEECNDCIVNNQSIKRYGIAVTDFNNDGDFEAVVTGYGAANQVWDWQNEKLVDIAPASLQDSQRRAIGVAACDIDGDGQEEVYFLNVDQFGGLGEVTDRLYDQNENDLWEDLFEKEENLSQVNRFSGRSVACLDRFASGIYGIFVANYGGPMKLFEVSNSVISEVGVQAGIAYTTGGRAVMSLPIFDEGMHIFAGNEQGANFLFRNNGDGTFDEIASEVGIADPYETVRGTTTLDLDNDGDFDLVYGNWEGPHRMWSWNGELFEDTTTEEIQKPSRIRTVIAADFDNDGNEELFFNNIGEANRFFRKTKDGSWIPSNIGDALEEDGLGTGAAVLDFDGDGQLELLIAHGESDPQPLSLYRWPSNENNYIRILPKTKYGAPARGAVVKVSTPTKTHIRSIDAGSGYLCQMEPVAHVGLGNEKQIDRVEITWPDGTTKILENTDINQEISVDFPM